MTDHPTPPAATGSQAQDVEAAWKAWHPNANGDHITGFRAGWTRRPSGAGEVKELVAFLARSRKPWGYAIVSIADLDRLVNSLLGALSLRGDAETDRSDA